MFTFLKYVVQFIYLSGKSVDSGNWLKFLEKNWIFFRQAGKMIFSDGMRFELVAKQNCQLKEKKNITLINYLSSQEKDFGLTINAIN